MVYIDMDTVKTKHIKYVQKCSKNKLIQGQMFIIFSSGIKEGLSRKDELFNDIIEHFFVGRKCDFPRSMAASKGSYITQVYTCAWLYYYTIHKLEVKCKHISNRLNWFIWKF